MTLQIWFCPDILTPSISTIVVVAGSVNKWVNCSVVVEVELVVVIVEVDFVDSLVVLVEAVVLTSLFWQTLPTYKGGQTQI